MARKKKRKTSAVQITLADVDLDMQKAYRFIGEGKMAHAKQAISRARDRLNVLRGLPTKKAVSGN